jgi:methylmalonyl-CoA mutase cobalamin-binding subunit
MIAVVLLALSLTQAAPGQTSKLDQLAQPAPAAASKAVAVILDCQIAAKTLTDCKAINEVADATVVAEAIRLAGGVALPDALADSGARIRIRMNVAP